MLNAAFETTPSCYDVKVDKKILSLVLTESCNLQCTYCYQPSRTKGAMSLITAKEVVAETLECDDEFREIIIELIGGEVMIYWNLITELIDWTIKQKNRWRKEFMFFIDTNGTLLNNQKKDWIRAKQPFVTMGLSLDGTPDAHNLNRSNSYDRISGHLDFFAELWPHQTVKMTISPATIPQIFDGIIHIMRYGLKVAANLPLEDIWGTHEEKRLHVDEFRNQIELLVQFFGEQNKLPLPSLINSPIHILFSEEERDRPWCGSGRSMLGVDVDGTRLACNRYARMSFDHQIFKLPITNQETQCNTCFFRPTCQTCEAHNWEKTGNPNVRTNFHCEFVKLQIWGSAQVKAIRLKRMAETICNIINNGVVTEPLEIEAINKRLIFLQNHLALTFKVLEIFENAKSLDEAGFNFYRENAFVPPNKAVWIVPQLQN